MKARKQNFEALIYLLKWEWLIIWVVIVPFPRGVCSLFLTNELRSFNQSLDSGFFLVFINRISLRTILSLFDNSKSWLSFIICIIFNFEYSTLTLLKMFLVVGTLIMDLLQRSRGFILSYLLLSLTWVCSSCAWRIHIYNSLLYRVRCLWCYRRVNLLSTVLG